MRLRDRDEAPAGSKPAGASISPPNSGHLQPRPATAAAFGVERANLENDGPYWTVKMTVLLT